MLKNEELLNANQVAAILNCHVTQVYKMIKVGQLPQWLSLVSACLAWADCASKNIFKLILRKLN